MGPPVDQSDRRGHRETLWLESCYQTHRLWCECSDWRKHVPGWQDTGDQTTGGGDSGTGGDIPDDVLVNFDLGFEDTTGGEDHTG